MAALGFDPEFVGSKNAISAQKAILAARDDIAGQDGLVSRGNRVAHTLASAYPASELAEVADRFGSAIFFLDQAQLQSYRTALTEAGFDTTTFLVFYQSADTFDIASSIVQRDLPSQLGLRLETITQKTPASKVRDLQGFMGSVGLPQLPGYVLRGRLDNHIAVALSDPDGHAVGCAISIDESGAGPDFAGWYFPSSIGVATAWQGYGLGRWLNAAAIDMARTKGAASHVREGVSPVNVASQRMIESCGLKRNETIAALLASRDSIPVAWQD